MIPALLLLCSGQQPAPILRSPDIHGTDVVFTCEGDLWVGDLSTGRASRLTRDVGTEFDARFSPDGSQIAYTGELDGIREIYVMPKEGGAPRRLTYLNEFAEMVDWIDGKTIAFRGRSYPSLGAPTLCSVSTEGSPHVRLPLEFASTASFAPGGKQFVFNRFHRAGNAWFGYRGGLTNDLWMGDLAAQTFRRIHAGPASAEFPVWLRDRVYFVTYEGSRFVLRSVGLNGQGVRDEIGPSDFEIRYLQGDENTLIYERGVRLETFDPKTKQSREVAFNLSSDLLHTRPFLVPAETTVFGANLGPSGRRVLVEARGQIVSLPAKDGDARVLLAKDGVRYRRAMFSPDGKKIAYFSDESGEMQLYVADQDGSGARQVTRGGKRQLKRIHWSPDGKRIAYTNNLYQLILLDLSDGRETVVHAGSNWGWDGPSCDFSPDGNWIVYVEFDAWTGVGTLALHEIASGKNHRIGTGAVDDLSPSFSPDGRYLAFLSRRHLAPVWDPIQNHLNLRDNVKAVILVLAEDIPSPLAPPDGEEGAEPKEADKRPMKVDLEGLYGRFVELPLPPSAYTQIDFAGDRVLASGSNGVAYFDLKARKAGTLTGEEAPFEVSADGKKVLLVSPGAVRVVDASGDGLGPTEGRLGFANLQLRIEPKAEWRGMFWDAWRHIRDYFYVANMHGLDWKAVGDKYAAMLPSVRSRDELTQLIRWMLAELSISHAFFTPGDTRSLMRPARPSFLGIDVEPSPEGYPRITRILRGGDFLEADRSPLASPGLGIREGDYLIEVAGRQAKGGDWQEGLLGRAGQWVSVKVNRTPNSQGARTVRVKPMASETRARYLQWVDERRNYVSKASGGKLGYLHLRAMVQDDMADFIRQYFPQRGKEGLVVDTRFNTGGNISDQVITILKQRPVGFWNQRNANIPWTRQGDFFPGPMACLINEFNYSDGEEFPHQWKALKLGPVVGRRTRGGEVGSDPGWPLADGGTISVPNYGMFTEQEGWIIEGPGVSPDIDVLSDPNAWARGKDPQLDKAVQVLLESIRKNPFRRPVQPPDPIRAKGGG